MTDKKSSKTLFLAILAIVFVVLIGGLYFTKSQAPQQITEEQQTTEMAGQNISETPADTSAPTAETPAVTGETPVIPATQVTSVDVNSALSDRLLGSTSAPMRIAEHASLTCSHCAEFHKDTFPQLKKDYIDTGKAYMVFSDFPLNAPALKAGMVARCLPKDKYFDFIQDLFENQEDWAFDPKYEGYLQKKAVENGLSEGAFKSCIENKEIQTGIENRMKGVQSQWNINSTPSFVINNRTTVAGAYKYEDFKKILDEEYAKVTGGTVPAAAPAAAEEKKSEAKEEAPAAEETPAEDETPAPADEGAAEEATPDDTSTAPAAEAPETEEGAGAATEQPQE